MEDNNDQAQMSITLIHLNWMREAMAMAEEALAHSEVPVGCIFVRKNSIIARARNRTNELRNASRHAELEAIDLILADKELTPKPARYPLADTVLYVTVEPCIMCACALRQLGIKEVFYGCENDKFGGCGSVLGVNASVRHPVHPSYQATGGYLRDEAIMILRRFYVTENTNGISGSKAKNKSGSQDRNSPEDPNLTAAYDDITFQTFDCQHEKAAAMIAEFINAFFHKVIQGYNTSGISSGADCSGKALNIITELDSSVPNTAQLALRKNKFRFPDAYGV